MLHTGSRSLSIAYVLFITLAASLLAQLPTQKTAPVPEWQNLGEFDIIPCPKQIRIGKTSIPINSELVIVHATAASLISKTAATDLAEIIFEKTSIKVPVLDDEKSIAGKNAVLVGTTGESAAIKNLCLAAKKDPSGLESQGYMIFPAADGKNMRIMLAGKDPQGVYWAAMTFAELIQKNEIRLADITDWPDFKWREVDTLSQVWEKLDGSKPLDGPINQAKKMIQFAARYKANCLKIQSVSHLQTLPKTDYYDDYRSDFLQAIGDYALTRGIKLIIELRSAVGVIGRDEQKFPQMKDFVKEKHLYYTWSDEASINYAMERLTRMVKKTGGHIYIFHPPDIPNIGWERRSDSDRAKWGDDRVSAECFLANRINKALKSGNPDSQMVYLYKPYWPTGFFHGKDKAENYPRLLDYEKKLERNITIAWREHSMETAQKLKTQQGSRPIMYWIENNSWHRNRLVGGNPRMYKSYLFENAESDILRPGYNILTFPQHFPIHGIHTEYAWNANAPGAMYVKDNPPLLEKEENAETYMMENGMRYWTWIYGPDLDGEISSVLLPRICRKLFGPGAAPALALTYKAGGTIHEDKMGGTAYSTPAERFTNSQKSADLLKKAGTELELFWGKPELFTESSLYNSYQIFTMVFKYTRVFQYLDQLNAWAKQLAHISESGETTGQADDIHKQAMNYSETARNNIAADYQKYDLDKIDFKAIYGQKIGTSNDVNKKIDKLKNEIGFNYRQIMEFGAGGAKKSVKNDMIIGISESDKIVIDGDLRDWDLSSPIIIDKSYHISWIETAGVKGNFDFTGYWFFRHDAQNLYMAALIYDNSFVFNQKSSIYNNDAIELWLNDRQAIISVDTSGKVLIETYHQALDASKINAAIKTGKGGYPFFADRTWWAAEIKIPLKFAGIDTAKEGAEFRLAFGADDNDEGEAASQFFFPDTFEHLSRPGAKPDNFARAVLVKKNTAVQARHSGFRVHNATLQDSVYTHFDLDFTISTAEEITGLLSEIRMYTDKGIFRYILDMPRAGREWKPLNPLSVNTKQYFQDIADLHFDWIIQTPQGMQIINLQKGKYFNASATFAGRENIRLQSTGQSPAKTPAKNALLYASFDNNSLDAAGSAKIGEIKSEKISFVAGKIGQAVKIEEGGFISFEHNCIKPEGAKISFWFQPLFAPADHTQRYILKIFDSFAADRITILQNAQFAYSFAIKGQKIGGGLSFKPSEVSADRWNYMEISWNANKVLFNINGAIKIQEWTNDMASVSKTLFLGAYNEKGEKSAPCLIDEFTIEGTE